MPRSKPLPAARLRATWDPDRIKADDSRAIAGPVRPQTFQPRATHALELALAIPQGGHHVYLAGEPGLGRSRFALALLGPRALKRPAAPDVVYLNNFEDPDKPLVLELPAGTGRSLRQDMQRAVARLREDLPGRFETEPFLERRDKLIKRFKTRRERLFAKAEDRATRAGFALSVDEEGVLTCQALAKGTTDQIMTPSEVEDLAAAEQNRLRQRRDDLLANLGDVLREMRAEERGFREREASLARDLAGDVLSEVLAPLEKTYAKHPRVLDHLRAVRADALEKLDTLVPRTEPGTPEQAREAESEIDDTLARYGVNLFVDNSATKGAPLIREDHPTAFNLLGCIEREAELGALHTDFSLIRPGSLHKANHGYLVLSAEDVLNHQSAWDGLLRALKAQAARIEDASGEETTRTRTIQPEPLPLDIKVILVGTDELYEHLLYNDPRFTELFKLKAHMQDRVVRSSSTVNGLLRTAARMAEEAGLPPFDRGALAALVDVSSRLAADQSKLSLEFPRLRDLMIEAAALARMRGAETVDAALLQEARDARDYRANLYEDEFLSDYDRQIIQVPTEGQAVGRVNGLSVSLIGDYVFGLPHQIACTVGVGEGGIIDLEREAQLGGPIHTKAMMILKSFLLGRFAHDKPLILAGSLYFEQSYAHVEGDSASGAELAALLSALAEVPIDLSYAFTGAVNQSGAVMAVGDVTRKIEGFFEVCRRRGLTGRQGVLIPADNVTNLMLKPEVVQAVENNQFSINPVRTIDDAMLLLTGLNAGKRRKDGRFPKGSLFQLVDERLRSLAKAAMAFRRKG